MTVEGDTDRPPRKSRRGLWLAAGLVALIGGGIWLWEEVLEDRLIPKRLGTVEAGTIYRSGQLSPALVHRTLDRLDVDVVVSLCAEVPGLPEHDAERQAADDLGIERLIFPLEGDGTGDIASYARAIAAMHEAAQSGRTVLVHCAAGSYRTGGVVAAYRLLVQGESPEAAREEMLEYGWDGSAILPEYLNAHMRELAERLVRLGVIDEVPEPLPKLPG